MYNSAFNMGIWAGALRFYVSVLEAGRNAYVERIIGMKTDDGDSNFGVTLAGLIFKGDILSAPPLLILLTFQGRGVVQVIEMFEELEI